MRNTMTLLLSVALAVTACGSDDDATSNTAEPSTESTESTESDVEALFPDVVDVEVTDEGGGEFTVAVTLSSPYDSPERYADAWRVLDEDGNELGVRELTHDHASEQPFTRQTTVAIPDDVERVTVEGRDQVSGYGGETVTVDVPR